MIAAIKRNGIMLGGILLCGLVCAMARPFLVSPRGDAGPTILQAESWPAAVAAVVVVVALAAVIAAIVGRVTNAVVGLFVLGTGLFVLAMRLSSALSVVWSDGSLPLMAIETLLLAVLLLVAVAVVFRVSGPLPDIDPPADGGSQLSQCLQPPALVAALAGAVVIPAVWVIAKSPMVGQQIGAVFVGAMVAGLAGRLIRPQVQPMLLFVSPLVFGGLAQLAAAAMSDQPLPVAHIEQSLFPLSYATPLQFAAGSLMGVAVGLGWAKSFLAEAT